MDAAVPATADAAPVMDEDAFRAFYDRTARPALGVSVSRDPRRRARRRPAAGDVLPPAARPRASSRARSIASTTCSGLPRTCWPTRTAAGRPSTLPLSEADGREDAAPDAARAMEQRTDVARALATLAPRDRDMLWLAYADGASHAEIASHLGVARPSVKAMLFRARRRLAARLRQVNAAFGGRGR